MIARKTFLWLLIGFFGLTSAALADKNRNQREIDALRAKRLEQKRLEWATAGKTFGACQAGVDFKDLDINSVRARLYNNGGLFWKGAGPLYNVPQAGAGNAIFASGIWIGGLSNGELRMAATDYGDWEMWPGPLDDNGNPPADCSPYDRLFKVNRQDVLDYNDTGIATPDLADWPWDLGAPVIDGDGNPNNYNLSGGDRPEVLGDQTIWWIMNDRGGEHSWTLTQPIGLEVQVTAFAFKTADALNNTTFYKYKLINKGGVQLTETYFGLWSDPDLGDATNDYVGSDTTRGIGYVWNGTDFDGGADGYGDLPPALGYDFFQGPLVNNDGIDNDKDGEVDEADERIGGTKFVYYNNDATVQGNPDGGDDAYRYLRGLWRDDVPITYGGSGRGFSNTPTDFMFPGDPPEFWSEENIDGAGSRNTPADRRFLISSGPFTLDPGAEQDIVFGIVWSQAGDRFASVQKMKVDDALAQAAFNVDFALPPPPDPPRVEWAELDGTIVLKWGYRPSDNNYMDSYDVFNPFLADVDVDDKTYTFEGYIVKQFQSENDLDGRVVATFDYPGNGVKKVVDISDATNNIPIAELTVNGSDNGIRHSMRFDNLTNYTDYYFGVQAYAYNANSAPLVTKSSFARVKVRPSKPLARNHGMVVDQDFLGVDIMGTSLGGPTDGGAFVRIVDPASITGHEYRVKFFEYTDPEDADNTFTTYNIIDHTTGEVKLSGQLLAETQGVPGRQVVPEEGVEPDGAGIIDGLDFKVLGPPKDFKNFIMVANGAGPIDPPDAAAFEFQGFPTPLDANGDPTDPSSANQVGEGHWGVNAGGGSGSYGSFISRSTRDGDNWANILPHDFEIRFTYEDDNWAWFYYSTENMVQVPFEIWDIGIDTPDDPSDDYRMFPLVLDENEDDIFNYTGADHGASGGTNDPYTDWIYWYSLTDKTPGESGYQAQVEDLLGGGGGALLENEVIARFVLVNWNGGDVGGGVFNQDLPEQGSIIRIITNKVNGPDAEFAINTAAYQPPTNNQAAAEEALDLMAIVPNPYKGASDYELTNLSDIARFTNLPQEATIRVFTLSGTLIKTFNKSGPSTSLDCDLTTDEGLPIASGMYLVHIEVPNVGDKVIKFGVVKKRVQLDLL